MKKYRKLKTDPQNYPLMHIVFIDVIFIILLCLVLLSYATESGFSVKIAKIHHCPS